MNKKLPAFQFYPGDWMKDPNLRRCTHAAKGLWMDLLCLMFESEERGVLISSRRAWSDEEIALAVGGDSTAVLACLQELILKGVALRRKDGALLSKRMIRDEKTRVQNIENGKKGGNRNLMKTVKEGDNPPDKPKPTPSSSSSTSSSLEEINKESSSSPDKPGELAEALAYAQSLQGYDPEVVKHWYASRDSVGWERVNGSLVRNWRSDLDAWVLKHTRDLASSPPPNRRPPATKQPAQPTRTSQYSW
jgi:hypothetical protein